MTDADTDLLPNRSISAATRAMRDGVIASTGTPIVFDAIRARGPEGIQFDVWYCNTHLPTFTREYKVQRLRRYAVPSRASYFAVGELDVVPKSPPDEGSAPIPAMVEHHERFVGSPIAVERRRDAGSDVIDSAIAYPAFLRVPAGRQPEIDRWYAEEHLPMLLACPQWVMTRRFRITAARGIDFNHVALHYLTDLRALQSPERDLARSTRWRAALVAEGWFAPEYRIGYRTRDF